MAAASNTRKNEPVGPLTWLGRSLWRWLNSLPVAIWVMLALAFLSMIGTIIPQEHLSQPEPGMTLDEMYVQKFGAERWHEFSIGALDFAVPLSRLSIIKWLGLSKVYFTWYFFALLLWLCVSAAICNVVRYRRTRRLWEKPPWMRNVPFYAADKRSVQFEADGAVFDEAMAELKERGYRVHNGEYMEGRSLYADKGFFHKWAMVVLHVAVIVLLFGGIYGKTYGNLGVVRLADDEESTLVLDVAKDKHPFVQPLLTDIEPIEFALKQDKFRIDWEQRIVMPSWAEELSEDEQQYHSYFVDDYVSRLRMESKRTGEVAEDEVLVNHPLVADKLVMYQSGYFQIGHVRITGPGIDLDEAFPSQTWLVLTPAGITTPAEAVGRGQPTSNLAFYFEQIKGGRLMDDREYVEDFGPLTLARFADVATGEVQQEVLLLTPEDSTELTMLGETYTLAVSETIENFSDFSYKRDPGIPVLYLGWILMILGIAGALYVPFTQVWIRYENGNAYLLISGRGSQKKSPISKKLRSMLGSASAK